MPALMPLEKLTRARIIEALNLLGQFAELSRFYPHDALSPKVRETIEGILSEGKGTT